MSGSLSLLGLAGGRLSPCFLFLSLRRSYHEPTCSKPSVPVFLGRAYRSPHSLKPSVRAQRAPGFRPVDRNPEPYHVSWVLEPREKLRKSGRLSIQTWAKNECVSLLKSR